MANVVYTSQTLDELDPPAWDESASASHLVSTCHRLRRKPLSQFTVEDLRVMIGQDIGLPWLVPLALEALERDPLAEGDFYPGDLLVSLLRVSPAFWTHQPDAKLRVLAILNRMPNPPDEVQQAILAFRDH
jgi:hypothetical protein